MSGWYGFRYTFKSKVSHPTATPDKDNKEGDSSITETKEKVRSRRIVVSLFGFKAYRARFGHKNGKKI